MTQLKIWQTRMQLNMPWGNELKLNRNLQDPLTSSQDIDPKGERTIGVLTKLDNLQASTDKKRVVEILENKTKPLKLGKNMILTFSLHIFRLRGINK